ncbi:PREDICTED: coiled-coil domain-containing protein 146 isoform X3 [Lepidothrix coronata]|nr:PREDICTED: coiled-coil domain-containing protein 146 isoform X3 [Lepidothrix coronata]XP_017666923.1 PREDICTED: coiled-coil domain-containing protein 146 isoform X3 [Lepidothrix coronata]XP_017666924.1 PREDICTED: coiled-coil domain-containing protein 146 isoform X3 [Lepidothrix coronata]XP_017666925.1 PREDICTED: coiled-coil domain-containing protein 146 isoform X3 [Lepidothrix coronata]
MSQAGEESSSVTEFATENEQQLTPTIYSRDEGSTDVTASPAFQCLDELFSAGKITDTKAAELKEQYTLLHKTVISLQESETQLLQEAKRLSEELEQQHELEKPEQVPEESSSEASQIRQQLLSCQSEYDAIKAREYENQLKIECLQEEKTLLENEYEKISEKKKDDEKIKQLKENCDELCKEVDERKAEIHAIEEAVSSKQKLILVDEEETEKLLDMQTNLKSELVKILGVPKQLAKETEKIYRKKIDAEKKNEALNDEIGELNRTLKAIEKRTEEILQEREDVKKELDSNQVLLESKERERISLTKLLEINTEKELAILSDREILENSLNKCILENKNQRDILTQKQTQKERELKNLKVLEVQLGMIYDSVERDKAQHKRLKSEVETNARNNEALLERRREVQEEIEMVKRRLAEQAMISDMDAHMLEECIAKERLLFKEQEKRRTELSKLIHLTSLRADERQLKSRDVQKAKIQLQSLIKELKRRNVELKVYKKRRRDIQNQLQGFAKMCDFIQIERDKCIQLVRGAQWKAREAGNRVKFLENKIENLRNTLIAKERKLQEKHMKIKINARIVEQLKKNYCKIAQVIDEIKEKQKHLNLERLTTTVTHIKEEIAQLHKKCERAIQQQEESGLLLRERDEELGFLHEKINRQEILCRNGDHKMQVMDDKISFLKLKVAEKKREIALCFKELPMKNALNANLERLQIQYSQCREKIKQLEKIFDDATNESRRHEMGGKDPSAPELLKKIEQLEAELLQKEQKLMQKEFLCESISEMTDRIRAEAENRKQDMLLFARRISELQRKIKDKTKERRALIAELTMRQSLVLQLQQEMREKEQFVMTASWRISQGLPPPKETEKEWLKILGSDKTHKAAAEDRAEDPTEEEQDAVPGHAHTTAQQCPTTSIPDEKQSPPFPRPHGAVAPLRPSESSSDRRHFSKSTAQPSETSTDST